MGPGLDVGTGALFPGNTIELLAVWVRRPPICILDKKVALTALLCERRVIRWQVCVGL